MRITGRVPVDLERSGIQIKYECPLCGFRRYGLWKAELGLHFMGEPNDWPDAFMMSQEITLMVFLKQRMAQFVVDQALRPIMLTRSEDITPYF